MTDISARLDTLRSQIAGEIHGDETHRILYATDASPYRELPLAVVYPKNAADIERIVRFANAEKIPLIPRAAGTSLAGQVVGSGIVVDVSRHMSGIIELNVSEKWVRIQPGVILDELNNFLEPHGLFFGPETSTANRCTLGGMLGNNACGAHSLIYGSTRDHVLEVSTILSDGSTAVFGALTRDEFISKCNGDTLEKSIYRNIREILSNKTNQENIRREYPDKSIHRRNTGYALDVLLDTEPFSDSTQRFNLSKLLAGSEGTLAFTTEIKLNLMPLPPREKGVVAVHLSSLEDTLQANLIALRYNPGAVELMDKTVLECTKANPEQQKNWFFIQGEPATLLIVEFARDTRDEINKLAADMEAAMRIAGYGYHFPVIFGADIARIWNLRKAGLGALSNMEGDAKPVTFIEDTAVAPHKLPDYIAEFKQMLARYNLSCVYHAHIGSGELHLRPILNLKEQKGVELFRTVALETAKLVKKYNGSLSGEHGDGRLRGEFIPLMLGEANYKLLQGIKRTWDPHDILNPGKITDTPPMNTQLRYAAGKPVREIETVFDFSATGGIIRFTEKCNGSADCRKNTGTMCPSYQATLDEQHVTRARANILREYLTNSKKLNPFDHREIYDTLDLCLSCKACRSECPSNVDMAKLKAEFLQRYHDANGVPLRSLVIGNIAGINKIGSVAPFIANFFMSQQWLKKLIKIAPQRELPKLAETTLTKWYTDNYRFSPANSRTVYLFADEFTNYNDVDIGIKAVKLLDKLGYNVMIPAHKESGRALISKGLLKQARHVAHENINLLKYTISSQTPLIGIEPSSILTFRDEYPDLCHDAKLKKEAQRLAANTFMIDEFIAAEYAKGSISRESFTTDKKNIRLHGHCQQKAIASTAPTKAMLSIPPNYSVEEIPSGCCGMAGSFGYEAEHHDLSMRIGEMRLFPDVRKQPDDTIICAPGTSCRHQIADGTGRIALHPVEVLWEALNW